MENVTGRLVEIRVFPPFRREDLAGVDEQLRKIYVRLSAPPVLCVDLRHGAVLDRESVSLLLDLQRSATLQRFRVEREAILLPSGNAIMSMQHERLAREIPNDARRIFHSAADAGEWLDQALTPRERARLTVFLAATSAVRRPAE